MYYINNQIKYDIIIYVNNIFTQFVILIYLLVLWSSALFFTVFFTCFIKVVRC